MRAPGAGIVRAPTGAAWLRRHPACNDNTGPLIARLARLGVAAALVAVAALAWWILRA